MLEFINVSKRFGSIEALSDISFLINEGEFVYVTGPSGAGKTTLLKLLIHELAPTSGEIFFNDIPIHSLKKSKVPKLRQSIGSVFQDFRLLANRTLYENTAVALAIKGLPRQEWEPRTEQVLRLVGLLERRNLFPSQLSGGELQRAALARALVVNPKLIFADEPTGNLDVKTAEGIMELLKRINEEGKTVIVTTHNLGLIKEYGGRELTLDGGKLVKDTHPKSKHKEDDKHEEKEEDGKEAEKEEKK